MLELAPTSVLNVPAGQAAQTDESTWPDWVEKVPEAHGTIEATVGQYEPAGQAWHTALEVAPSDVPYVPDGHDVHTLSFLAPVAAEYEPASHSVRAPPAQKDPAGHSRHVAFEVAPGSSP